MITDAIGKQLHDRATRDEPLTAQEQTQLKEWYTTHDKAEMKLLGLNESMITRMSLQEQVTAALEQLSAATKRLQELAEENETLRRENATLRQQVSRLVPQTA
ncbi:MAG: hypothetical protein AAB571_06205 [Chloroflexota bacterium]